MTESQTTPEPARPPHPDAPTPPVPPTPAAQAAAGAVPARPAVPGEAAVGPVPVDESGPVAGPAPEAAPPAPEAALAAPGVVPAGPVFGAAPEAPSRPAPADPAVLDEGTYTRIREPRSEGRLPLDGTWHQISPKYVASQTLQNALFAALVIAGMLALGLVLDQPWAWWVGGALLVITILTQIILPRQARALGYMLREDDIVFRKGILWQRVVAVPYGRMQLVDITHGPMDRAFGIAKLKLVTAAATTGVEIPGLSQPAAEALRDTLIQVAETRRTGL